MINTFSASIMFSFSHSLDRSSCYYSFHERQILSCRISFSSNNAFDYLWGNEYIKSNYLGLTLHQTQSPKRMNLPSPLNTRSITYQKYPSISDEECRWEVMNHDPLTTLFSYTLRQKHYLRENNPTITHIPSLNQVRRICTLHCLYGYRLGNGMTLYPNHSFAKTCSCRYPIMDRKQKSFRRSLTLKTLFYFNH